MKTTLTIYRWMLYHPQQSSLLKILKIVAILVFWQVVTGCLPYTTRLSPDSKLMSIPPQPFTLLLLSPSPAKRPSADRWQHSIDWEQCEGFSKLPEAWTGNKDVSSSLKRLRYSHQEEEDLTYVQWLKNISAEGKLQWGNGELSVWRGKITGGILQI